MLSVLANWTSVHLWVATDLKLMLKSKRSAAVRTERIIVER